MMSIIPLNKINNTIKVINKSSIICNSHALRRGIMKIITSFLFICMCHKHQIGHEDLE